jgi:hypothetical protein
MFTVNALSREELVTELVVGQAAEELARARSKRPLLFCAW